MTDKDDPLLWLQISCQKRALLHFLSSGVIGTGLMLLSRHPIVDSAFHRFSLNGFMPAVWLGDGAAAKGVAMAALRAPNGLRANVYTSHYHAEYDRKDDWYIADRACQVNKS